ncbi:MAG: protein kinase, partial [Gemmatimonadaceae bacterium]|nr:protein kinase [Gemmatimonadaceae bacterium]
MTSPALSERLQAALGSGYRIERELGGGGMSRVFVAEETAFGRQVVIKVLPPELAAAVNVERFRREIQLAAQLQHPNIVPLHAAGIADDLPYFTMPFVTGETLRARIARSGELPVNDTVKILRDVLTALSYAHEHGVVHRDIKPDNVLLTKHHALVADFGVAKAISASAASGGSVTSVGIALGTPAYMAPEQAAADPSVDHRADLYAVGLLAYEMLTGDKVFGDRTPQQMLAAHAIETPEPIKNRRPAVPPELAQLVMHALEKHPADRPQTAEEMLATLDAIGMPSGAGVPVRRSGSAEPHVSLGSSGKLRRRILMGAAAAGVVAAVGVWQLAPWRNGESPDAAAPAKMLAVLPFENLGRPENEYFADGMSEEVRGKLAGLSGLMVIARSSSMEYKQTKKPARQIARELGVQYLLAATIRSEPATNGRPARVRVSPELIQLVNGAPITRWQQAFDADMTDVFQVQADIAQRVAQALDIALAAGDSSRLVSRPTQNLAAYDAYLQGEEASSALAASDANSLQRAMRFYERATVLDTTFSQAFARLSQVRTLLYLNSSVRDTGHSSGPLAAAERAVALAPGRPEGRLALAEYYTSVARDPTRARDQVRLALALAPDDPEVVREAASVAMASGRSNEALTFARKAQALDPRSAFAAMTLGDLLLWLRRYDDARVWLDLGLSLAPRDLGALHRRVMLDLARGDLKAARSMLAKAQKTGDPAALVAYVATFFELGWV